MSKPTVITSFAGEAVDKFLKTYGYLPSEETGPQLLKRLGIDAAKWCAEMSGRGIVKADPAPGGDFHGWMCNAIMYAYDKGIRDAGGSPNCSPYWLADTTPEAKGSA